MGDRFRDSAHLVRMAGLFVVGLVLFLVGRSFFVPDDFGIYGHYRAGALDDARARPIVFAGQAACVTCHADVGEARQAAPHARVSCEACHGPLATHAAGEPPLQPRRPDGRDLCVACHAASPSKPTAFPQVVVSDHAGDARCIECHNPHTTKVS